MPVFFRRCGRGFPQSGAKMGPDDLGADDLVGILGADLGVGDPARVSPSHEAILETLSVQVSRLKI